MRAFLRLSRTLGAVIALVAPVVAVSAGGCGGDAPGGGQTPPDQDASGAGDSARDASADACVPRLCTVSSSWDPKKCMCVPNGGDSGCTRGLGESCGGFAPQINCCMPGLTCVIEAGYPDAPGTCQ
jgi:hypothetical protein